MPELNVRDIITKAFNAELSPAPAVTETKSQSVADMIHEAFHPPREQKPVIAPRGPVAELASSLGAGYAQTAESVGGTMEMLGVPGGQTTREYWHGVSEIPSLQRPTYLQQDDSIRASDWRWWVRNVGENIPNLVMMYGTGAGAGAGAKLAGAGIKAISRAAMAGGFGSSFTMEAGSQYAQAKSEMLQEGRLNPAEIEDIATKEGLIAGITNAIIELIPLENVFARTPAAQHILKRIIKQSVLEGSTEMAQEGVNVFAEKVGHKPDQRWSDQVNRILTSGIVGGVMGGTIGGPAGAIVHNRQAEDYNNAANRLNIKNDIINWKKSGLADEVISDRVEEKLKGSTAEINLPQDIDAREMTDFILYGTGAFTPPQSGFVAQARRGANQMRQAFGLKKKTQEIINKSAMPDGGMTTSAREVTDIGQAQQDELRQQDAQKKTTRAKAESLFSNVLADLTAEAQAQVEAARIREAQIKEAEQARLAQEQEQQAKAAIAATSDQQNQIKEQLAAADPRRQAIVDDVMTMTDRRLFTAAQKEEGWNIVPDGRGSYALVTPQGNVPMDLMQIRRQLAASRLARQEEKDRQDAANAESVLRMEAQSAAHKAAKEEKAVLALARRMLSTMSISPEQEEFLDARRDQLTEQEIARLDRIKERRNQTSNTEGAHSSPARPQSAAIIEETANHEPQPSSAVSDAQKISQALIGSMLIDLDNAREGGKLSTDEETGATDRSTSGVRWLSAVNKQGIKGGLSVREARAILTKAQEGQELTERQERLLDTMTAEANKSGGRQWANAMHWAEQGFLPQDRGKIAVNDLVTGDRLVIANEEFKVTDIDDDGNVTLKDGTIKKVRDGAVLTGIDFFKPVKAATEFSPAEAMETHESQESEVRSQKSEETTAAAAAHKSRTKEDKSLTEIVKPAATSQAAPVVYEPIAFGSENKIFTEDKANKAREILRKKLGGINVGVPLDPEIIQAGIDLAGYYIEGGSRSFGAYASKMINDLGDTVRPYLKSFYMAVRNYPGFDKADMDNEAALDEIDEKVITPEDKKALEKSREKPKPADLTAYGLTVQKGKTNTGKTVWNVSGKETRTWKDTIKKVGGRWYGPKKVWSFYNEDPTAALLAALPPEEQLHPSIKPVDNDKIGDYNKTERDKNHGIHDESATKTKDDRAGAEGSGAADVPGTKTNQGAGGVSGGTRRDDDGHVRSDIYRIDAQPVTRDSERLPAPSPGFNIRTEPGVGRSNGDMARIQRSGAGAGTDHVITPGAIDRSGSWINTASQNLDIIELAKRLNDENRPATPEEQNLLARYTGFGSSAIANHMFPGWAEEGKIQMWRVDAKWKPLVERMTKLLTPDEIAAAARSTQYAHYTSAPIISSIYRALEKFGFAGGRVLEPGMGVGSFFGLMPEAMRAASKYTGIEMDAITAQIAKHLYPHQNLIEGDYTKQRFPNGFFDLGIGNPPFSSVKILSDPDYKKLRLSLHDFFFVKTLDKIRPGGLMVFITSRYTMDKQDDRVRKMLNQQADLLGAIRLPQTAFKHNAGTEVVTDVLFLRKKVPGEPSQGQIWDDVAPVDTPEGEFLVNEYFAAHPEMVLGQHSGKGKMYGPGAQYTVLPSEGDVEAAFDAAVTQLPSNVYSMSHAAPAVQEAAAIEKDFNPLNKKEGGLYLSEKGVVMVTESGAGMPITALAPKLAPKDLRWLSSYIELRNAVKQCQHDQLHDGNWEKSLQELNRVYATFKLGFGRILDFTLTERKDTDEDGNEITVAIRKFKNIHLLKLDVEHPLVTALEKITEDGKIVNGPFLEGRTIKKPVEPEIKTAPDALAVSLNERGKLDLGHIASLLGQSEADVIEQLGDLIYEAPDKGYVTADEYLSGDVVTKLADARAAAKIDPKYNRNVDALAQSQPTPLSSKDVTVSPGSSWVPVKYYNSFIHTVLELPTSALVNHSTADNQWSIEGLPKQSQRGRASEWSTPDRGANEIFMAVLNNATIRVYHTQKVNGQDVTSIDPQATAQVNDVAKRMRARFKTWVWEDANRAREILDIYNATRNNIVPRRFDGRHLTLPGVSLRYTLLPHQKEAIWRIIQDGNTYIAHAVGAGKTYEMVAAGMEMKRLGLISKPLYVVPNHMLQQFSNEFQDLYPMAHIMVADDENFHTSNRRRFMAQAALNNPDAIVITHSAFGLLKMKEENITPVRDEIIDELRLSLNDLQGDKHANRIRIKQMEKRIEQTEQRFAAMIAQGDNVLTFEDMGVDFLFVDEAHQFRKLDFTTNRQAKGIDPVGSVRAMGLYIKTKWLGSQRPGRSHVFASGTPITNTMGELYTIMKYFSQEQMARDGIDFFDSWATEYGEMASVPEMNAAGRYEIVDRFAKFVNVPELMSRVRMFMDVLTSSQLGGFVQRPKIQGGQPTIVVTPASPALKTYQDEILQPRIETSRHWKPSPQQPGNPDPLINIITDGRLASIDIRFVQPDAPNDPGSKLNQYIDTIIRLHKETKDSIYLDPETGKESPIKGAAQICFFNHGFGRQIAANRGFDARAWAMSRFKEAGIPASEIAWIEDYDTAAKKEAVMKEVRSGTKRILLGSAKKMGTGMNVQTRLANMTYLDPPWYPSDVEQPLGRIIRQGNQNKEVGVYYFSTRGSYDATMWQMVTRKAKFIEDALAGGTMRSLEDISEASLYEMAAALASGDERAIRLAGLNADINNLENLRSAHFMGQRNLAQEKDQLERLLPGQTSRVDYLTEAAEKSPAHIRYAPNLEATIGAQPFRDKKEFGQALRDRIVALRAEAKEGRTIIGTFFGMDLVVAQAQQGDTLVHHGGFTQNVAGKMVNQLQLRITDKITYEVATDITETSDVPGLVTRLLNRAQSVHSDLSEAEQQLENMNKELKKINARLGAPFELEQDLPEKVAEAAQLTRELEAESRSHAPTMPAPGTPIPAIAEDTEKTKRLDAAGIKQMVVDLSHQLKGTSVSEHDGNVYLKVTSGEEVAIDSVESINANQVQISGHYDQKTVAGKRVAGMFANDNGQFSMTLSRTAGKAWTLSHEFYHFLEAIGAISNADKLVLNRKITVLLARDADEYRYLTGRSAAEQRAEYAGRALMGMYDAKSPSGKILARVREVIDRILNALGIRTAGGVVRDIRSGKIYDETGRIKNNSARKNMGVPGTQYYAKRIISSPEVRPPDKFILGANELYGVREDDRNIKQYSLEPDLDKNTQWWVGRDIHAEIRALPKKYFAKANRDLINEGYVPITRAEADELYYNGLDIFIAWAQIRGQETTGLEGIFMRPLSFYGYSYIDYKGNHVVNKEAKEKYMAYRQRYNDRQRAIQAAGRENTVQEGMRADTGIQDELQKVAEQTETYSDGNPESQEVTNPNTIARLESGKKIKVYRAMQIIDGKLYPPMSASIAGKLRPATKIGVWEKAVEMPELADDKGYFKLEKGNKKSIKARYNPYFHTSRSPLNDQFSEAYKRPNLVTIEAEIPANELTSGYKAEKAKDTVGEMSWHSGPVSSKLPGDKSRKVILSRYAKAVRIVPDGEVAKIIAEMLGGENITIPDNVVTPSLKRELIAQGVNVGELQKVVESDSRSGNAINAPERKPEIQTQYSLEEAEGANKKREASLGQKAEDVFAKHVAEPLGRKASQGVATLTGRAAPEARATVSRLAKHFREFWKPFSTVPDGDKILAKRYQAMGNVARAVRFIDEMNQKMASWPDEVKRDVFWYLNGDIPIESIPEEARDLAKMIQRRTEVIGEMLVNRGILAEGQFEKYRGKYVHYLYAKHVLGEDAPVFLTATGKLNLTYTKSRNPNMTLQQRKELGLIEDASVAVPVGMGKALTDIAKYDYLESIADNPDWVWQPSMINIPMGAPLKTPIKGRTRRFVKMGIGKLVEEVKIYDQMMAAHPSPEVSEIRDILRDALVKAEQASENMPDDFVQLPTSRGYGALAGAYVRKPIADDLMPVLDVATDRGKLMNTLLSIERQGMAGFKMGKVALNFPTAFRNVISNIIQNNMRGRPLSKIPGDIIKACESLKAKDQYYEEAFGMGLFHTNWFVSEINDVLDAFRKVKAGRIDQLMIAVKNVAKYYGKIDDINKLAIFIEQREAGKTADEATLTAMKWGMDYSLTSRSIKGLRQTIMPFACVDEETEILTKRGWLRHEQLKENDIALSLDVKDSLLKWQFISDIYRSPYDGDMLHFKDRNLDMMLTPDHKCIVYEDKQKNFDKRKEYNLRYAHSLNTRSKIPVAGKYEQFPAQSRISDAMVQIIGWVVTEGQYKKNTAQVCISQNEGRKFDKIKKALDQEFPDNYYVQRVKDNQMVFHIHAMPARHIRYYVPNKQLTAEFILALTQPQLKLLIETMIDGDGSRRKNNKGWQFIQKKNQTLDMFSMALVLSGISHGYCDKEKKENHCQVITYRQNNYYSLRRTKPENVHYTGIIWCPSVPGTGTWVARRNGRVFLTGNTYQYKIAPLIAESLQKRPWVLAKFALLYPAAKMLAMALHDLDDDDWEDLEKQLPAYIKKSGSMLILPWKSDKGQWQWINMEYFFPWGNMLAIFRDAKQMDSGEALRDLGISNPFLSMFYTGLSTREDQPPLHAYFGTPVYNELDPGWMKAAKYLEYMANTWAPSMLTRQGAIGYTGKAIMGTEDRWGRTVSLPQAAGRWFGLNIVSVSPEQSRAQVSVKIQELHKELSRIEANPSYSEEEKAAYRSRMNERLAALAEASPSSVLPILKAKGPDPVYDALKEMAGKGILHTAPPSRSVEIGGTPYKMTMDQYRVYLQKSSDIARPRLAALVAAPGWSAMSDERKARAVSAIVSHARKGVRQRIKAEIARTNRDKLIQGRQGAPTEAGG